MSDETNDVVALREQLAALAARIDQLESQAVPRDPSSLDATQPTTRRAAFRLAAGAAAGAVAATAVSRPVAADDPNDVTLGVVKSTASRPTGSRYTGAGSGVGALFAAGAGAGGTSAEFSAALGAWSHSESMPNGLYGFSEQAGAAGVVGKNEDGSGGVGVRGIGANYGVWGETRSDHTTDNWGVVGIGKVGVYGEGLFEGVFGTSSLGFPGVRGEGSIGGRFIGSEHGIEATGDEHGAVISGGLANAYLPATAPTPPTIQGGPLRAVGELAVDGLGDLWFCVESGTPGGWRRLAGPATAGAFHAIGPFRMYDSRLDAYSTPGKLGANASRVIDVSDGRDVDGVVIDADAVPSGATAVSINLTVTATEAPSFLAAGPGDATDFSSSSINWWRENLTIANGLIVPLAADRTLKFFAGPGGAAHFVVDVAGYWR